MRDYKPSTCHRGSSPSAPVPQGTDEWVCGVRTSNGTADEWLANADHEAGTLPDRVLSTISPDGSGSHGAASTRTIAAA